MLLVSYKGYFLKYLNTYKYYQFKKTASCKQGKTQNMFFVAGHLSLMLDRYSHVSFFPQPIFSNYPPH